jgi:hypothetical protein
MYKHGKPTYRLTHRPMFVILVAILVIMAVGYFFIIRPNSKNRFNNDPNARTTTIKDTSPSDTPIDGDVFTAVLPGGWQLTGKDFDARYHSYQWNSSDKKNNGRLFRVYVDTIPTTQAVNYLLPVKVQDNTMSFGTVSDNCVNFTQGAVPEEQRPVNIPVDKIALPSRWDLVDFLCDNGNVSHQVVGAASSEGLNTVTLSGPTKGKHKFFFMYQDNSINPDFGQFDRILSTFKVK